MKEVCLMYHDIVTECDKSSGFQNDSAFQYKVLDSNFEKQVEQFEHHSNVVFTFDDGGVSFIEKAAPVLERYGKKGIFFISTKHIGMPGFLDNQQIKDLERRGHLIGSHSHSHPQNMAELSDVEIMEEWSTSSKILENILGHKIEIASIPNGYKSKKVIHSAWLAGYRVLYTSDPTTLEKGEEGIRLKGRYVVHRDMSTNNVSKIVSSNFERNVLYLKWSILELIKAILGKNYSAVKSIIIK